ncbi:MAG: hypothetical protein OEW58_07385 [Gammaproteobacteria bacterium]|nr:hypothetical protein [Gammaproteobacteria bacterium]
MSDVIRKRTQRIFTAIALLFSLSLGGCLGGGGGDAGSTPTIPPYSGALDIAVTRDDASVSATVTWDASSGDAFRVYYSSSADPGVQGSLLTPQAGVTTGTISGNMSVGSGLTQVYFWITRVSGSGESAPFGRFPVVLVAPLQVTYSNPLLSLSGNTVSVTGTLSGVAATKHELHQTSTSTEALSATTLQNSNANLSALTATISSFVDSSGAPLSSHFAYVGEYSGTSNGQRGGTASYVSRIVQRQTLTPTLDALAIANSGSAYANWPILATSAKYVVWSANNATIAINKTTGNFVGGISANSAKEIVVADAANAAFHIAGLALHKTDLSGAGAHQSASVSTPTAPVAVSVDGTYVYVADATKVMRFSQADITGASATLDAARAGLTDMAVKGTSLYLATSSGIEVINNLNATPTAPALLFGTTNPVKALAIDDVNNKLYYIAASLASPYGADAIFELNLANPTSAAPIQENIFSFSHFHFSNGSLYWMGSQVYQFNLATSTLKRRVGGGKGIIALAANDDHSVYVLRSGTLNPLSLLPAGYSYASTAPAASPVLAGVSVMDTRLDVSLGSYSANDAEAVLYFADGVYKGRNLDITGLTNGTTYAITAKLANVSGVGIASAAVNGTPKISVYKASALVQAGQVTIWAHVYNPTANARSVTAKLYVGSATPVNMTVPPVVTATKSMLAGPADDTIMLTYTTPNDSLFFYNVVVTEDATGSISDAVAVAGSEAWSNSAPAGVFQTGTLYPVTGKPTDIANVGAYIYMSLNGGAIYRVHNSTLATPEQVATLPVLHGLATVDGAEMYGYNATTRAVYAITQGDNATVANVGSTVVLDSTTNGFSSNITAIDAVVGTVFVGNTAGEIWAADWNGATASNPRLVKNTAGGPICHLQAFGSEIFWSQKTAAGSACTNSAGSAAIRSTLADGTGIVTDLVSMTFDYIKHFQAISIAGTPYLYYSEHSYYALTENQYNQIKRVNLINQTIDVPVAEATSNVFAVASDGKIYFDKDEGVIYTLDANNRRIGHTTSAPSWGVTGIKLLKPSALTTRLYVYGQSTSVGDGGLAELIP